MPKFIASLRKTATRWPKTVKFYGMDLTTPRFQVSEDRAIDSLNYTWKDGAIHKRNGLKPFLYLASQANMYRAELRRPERTDSHITKISTEELLTDEEIASLGKAESHSIFPKDPVYDMWALDSDTLIVHKGCALFYGDLRKGGPLQTVAAKNVDSNGFRYGFILPERKVCGFAANGKLWILDGNHYCVVRKTADGNGIEHIRVANSEITYTPTTTIGITANEALAGGNRMRLEAPNLLSQWRKNVCCTGIKTQGNQLPNGARTYTYMLDGKAKAIAESDISKIRIVIHTTGMNNQDDQNDEDEEGK